MKPTSIGRSFLQVGLAASLLLAGLGCGDSSGGICEPNNLNHRYEDDVSGIELLLSQNCGSGAVTGDLYDADSYKYDLTGTAQGDQFMFTATRPLPSGEGVDTYRGTLEILNRGITLRGPLSKNGISTGDSLTFMAQAD